MRHVLSVSWSVVVLAALALALPRVGLAQEHMHEEGSLHGAWLVTSWEVEGEAYPDPQPGLILFTHSHYSVMYVSSGEPRAALSGESTTDTELAAAYRTITANSGRYEVSGNEITTRAFVAKNPNYMAAWPENASTYTFSIEGDTLTLTWPNGAKAILRQVDDEPAPW